MRKAIKMISSVFAVGMLSLALVGCNARDVLGMGTGSGGGNHPNKEVGVEDMKTLLVSFIEMKTQPEIKDACFMDPNILQIGNHVVTFPCSLSQFMEMTGFETAQDTNVLLSAGESKEVKGVLDGSEYSFSCYAKATENMSTPLNDALVDKSTIRSDRYGNKAFIFPAGVRPSFTTAKELVETFGNPTYVNTDLPEDFEEGGDTTSYGLVYKYYLEIEPSSDSFEFQEAGVNYYIDRETGMVTDVTYTDQMEYIIHGDIEINGYGGLKNNTFIPLMKNESTTENVDGTITLWKPYEDMGKYYSLTQFNYPKLFYDLEGMEPPMTERWYEYNRAQLDAILNGSASESASGSVEDVQSQTVSQESLAAQYRDDLLSFPEEVALLKLDGFNILTNSVGYCAYQKICDNEDNITYAYFCNTDVRPNNLDETGLTYFELRKAKRDYGAGDSKKISDSNVIAKFDEFAKKYAIEMLRLNS